MLTDLEPPPASAALPFGLEAIEVSEHLVPGSTVVDLMDDGSVGTVDDLSSFHLELAPHEGRALLVCPAPDDAAPDRDRADEGA